MNQESQWCPESTATPSQDSRDLVNKCLYGEWRHLGMQRRMLTGIIRSLLISHYSVESNISSEANNWSKPPVWTPGDDTGILIETIHNWRESVVQKRPAVIIKPNAEVMLRIAIDDKVSRDREGNSHYSNVWVGSHTVFCIHGTGAAAEILYDETKSELSQFAPVVRENFQLLKFQCTEGGAIYELEESTENFVVPITIAWAYQMQWMIRREAHKLAHIDFSFTR